MGLAWYDAVDRVSWDTMTVLVTYTSLQTVVYSVDVVCTAVL